MADPTCPTCGSDIPSHAQLIADARREVEGHGADPDALCCPGGTFGAGTWAAHVLAQMPMVAALEANIDSNRRRLLALELRFDEIVKLIHGLSRCVGSALRRHALVGGGPNHDLKLLGDIQAALEALAKEPTRG